MNNQNGSASCAICRSTDTEKITINRSFGIDIFACRACGFVQSEYVSDSALLDYYSRFYRPRLSGEEVQALRRKSHDQAVSQVEYLELMLPGKTFTNVLDYGASDGELAKLLKKISRAVFVTESDPQYETLLREEEDLTLLGESDLDSTRYRGFFDLVSISHVLEHLNDPLSALEKFSRLLKRSGFLFVDLPNELEMLTRAGFQAKGHLSYFTVQSFKQLVRVHGKFDILEIRTCNHSVEDFMASGFRLPEHYSLGETPNGTVIRSLLRNARPDAAFDERTIDLEQSKRMPDEYSRPILHLHQGAADLRTRQDDTGKTDRVAPAHPGEGLNREIARGEELFHEGRFEDALGLFESVLQEDPFNIAALNNKGMVLNSMDKPSDAIGAFQAVLRLKSDHSDSVLNLISAYLAVNNFRDAEETLMYYGHCLTQEDIETLRTALESIRLAPDPVDHAMTGMSAHPSPFDRLHEQIGDTLHSQLFFIMGVPRSGTTWLQHLLDEHPQVICTGEGDFNIIAKDLDEMIRGYNQHITQTNKKIGDTGYLTFTGDDLDYLFVTCVALLLGKCIGDPNIRCVGSKNPVLMKNLELYYRLFHTAKFINMIRDGRDVIVSAWFSNLRVNENRTREIWPDFHHFVEALAPQWASDVRRTRSFGQAHGDRYIDVRYEDLHGNWRPFLKKLFQFLDVDASESLVDQCGEAGAFDHLSRGRKRGNEDRKAFYRKGIVGDWKNHFDRASLDVFMKHAGDLMQELGYESNLQGPGYNSIK